MRIDCRREAGTADERELAQDDQVGDESLHRREVLEPREEDRAAGADELHRERDRRGRDGCDVHHDVGHPPAGDLGDALHGILGLDVDRGVGTQARVRRRSAPRPRSCP